VSKRPFVLFGLFALICVVVLPILALGKETSPDTGAVQVASRDTDARDLFQNNCGSCHTLDAAGSDGVVGPDLDDILVTGGINDETQFDATYTRVLGIVLCGREGRMPRGILLGEDAEEVSAFVAAYAGRIGEGPTVNTDTVEKPEAPGCDTGAGG
jgi:mono/diheme cytochrome c family protein